MFSGIVEALGTVENIITSEDNKIFIIECPFASELKIDQSVAHNGVCLTVTKVFSQKYTVTAIKETLGRTNLNYLKVTDKVNLERSLKLGDRIDGHLVQGHVDLTGRCTRIVEQKGSWLFEFAYDSASGHILAPKGAVCVNGVSLTVVQADLGNFSVAIIPYTFENTTFKGMKVGQLVNLEFDIIGKYVQTYLKNLKY